MQQELRPRPRRPAIEVVPDAPTEPDAFLRWSAERPREEGRYELSRGVVTRTMINVTRRHATICTNIVVTLSRLLDRDRFGIFTVDFAVRTPYGVRGPDIMAELANPDGDALASEKPLFLAEVLSPSTAGIDFSDKRDEYLEIKSLQTYLICSQDEARVWVWQRGTDGLWPVKSRMLEGRDVAVELGGLAVSLALADIYRRVPDRDDT